MTREGKLPGIRPTPWTFVDDRYTQGEVCIRDADNYEILNSEKGTLIDDDNFRRIVACVNFCAGLPTSALERANARNKQRKARAKKR